MDLVFILISLICCGVACIFLMRNHRRPTSLFESDTRNRRVLFVIAHPDDECMFFAPTILALSHCGQYDVFLLCLSSGNYCNKGRIRQQELINSCGVLGIRSSNVFVIDRGDLADDPNVMWDVDVISKVLGEHVKEYYIDLIFTFDEFGVSGHANHRSLYLGVRHFLSSVDCPAGVVGQQLQSVNILRKYSSFLDLAISYITSNVLFVSRSSEVWKAQTAMYAHRSQFVWFRALYILFSRYMIINSYKPITLPTKVKFQ